MKYITSKSEQQRIVHSSHCDPTSGHLGIRKCVARVKERFMWKGIWDDVKNMVGIPILLIAARKLIAH